MSVLSWAAGHHDVVGLGVAAIWAGLCAAYRPCVGLACYKVWGKNFFTSIKSGNKKKRASKYPSSNLSGDPGFAM